MMKALEIVEHLLGSSNRNSGESDPEPPPEDEIKEMRLGDILAVLPDQVQEQVIDVLNSSQDSTGMTNKLKTLLTPHTEALESIGIVPGYLAYMLVYVVLPSQRG